MPAGHSQGAFTRSLGCSGTVFSLMFRMDKTAYSICIQCRKLNKVGMTRALLQKPICGSCKAELPISHGVNTLGASDLMKLIDHSPIPVVVDFWATWCQPCKMFAPVFQQAAETLSGEFTFAKVDTEAHPLASTTYGIRGIPTLILFQNGFERARQSGMMPYPQFVQWLGSSLPRAAAA